MKRQVSLMLTLTFMLFAAATAAAKTPSACELLKAGDVKAIQGHSFEETKLTMASVDGMITSQCFYRLPSFADSISVTVIRAASPTVSAEQLWEKLAEEEGEKEEEGEELKPAREITGLGEEAFWAGNKFAGAMYVLDGHAILRVSVGGGETMEKKIEKTRRLAALALRALPEEDE
jgi:hypothetical protein